MPALSNVEINLPQAQVRHLIIDPDLWPLKNHRGNLGTTERARGRQSRAFGPPLRGVAILLQSHPLADVVETNLRIVLTRANIEYDGSQTAVGSSLERKTCPSLVPGCAVIVRQLVDVVVFALVVDAVEQS